MAATRTRHGADGDFTMRTRRGADVDYLPTSSSDRSRRNNIDYSEAHNSVDIDSIFVGPFIVI